MRALRSHRKSLLAAGAFLVLVLTDRAFGAEALGTGLLFFALAHCDTVDGPVVKLAREALETGNVNLVLPWVGERDEAHIRRAFEHAVAVRKLGPQAQSLADHHFYETLVRIHRAGEGAPYTGLKPAGLDLGPAVPAADRALEDGSVDKLVALLSDAVRRGVQKRFEAAKQRKSYQADDVRAGRSYVEAYVPYIHYVERLWQDASGTAHGHAAGHEDAAAHHLH